MVYCLHRTADSLSVQQHFKNAPWSNSFFNISIKMPQFLANLQSVLNSLYVEVEQHNGEGVAN